MATHRGATIRDLVEELARVTPTQEELAARHAAATTHLRTHLCPDLDDDDLKAGEHFWREFKAGRLPSSSVGQGQNRATEQ